MYVWFDGEGYAFDFDNYSDDKSCNDAFSSWIHCTEYLRDSGRVDLCDLESAKKIFKMHNIKVYGDKR